jgi:hypothetical protein
MSSAADHHDDDADLDLIAASLRADTSDIHTFVEGLAAKLEQAVPGHVEVQRRRDGLFGPKFVQRLALSAGDQRLELRAERGVVQTSRARVSGGIVLKTEPLETDAWLAAVGEALTTEARRSETTRQALERLLIQQ